MRVGKAFWGVGKFSGAGKDHVNGHIYRDPRLPAQQESDHMLHSCSEHWQRLCTFTLKINQETSSCIKGSSRARLSCFSQKAVFRRGKRYHSIMRHPCHDDYGKMIAVGAVTLPHDHLVRGEEKNQMPQ